MEWLAAKKGRDHVASLIDGGLDAPLTFTEYPRSGAYLLSLRRRINEEILQTTDLP